MTKQVDNRVAELEKLVADLANRLAAVEFRVHPIGYRPPAQGAMVAQVTRPSPMACGRCGSEWQDVSMRSCNKEACPFQVQVQMR